LAGDVARGEDHAHGGASDRSGARQAVQSAGERGEADVRLGQCEPAHSRGNDEVAASAISKPAAHRKHR